jgi:hypothetical protein
MNFTGSPIFQRSKNIKLNYKSMQINISTTISLILFPTIRSLRICTKCWPKCSSNSWPAFTRPQQQPTLLANHRHLSMPPDHLSSRRPQPALRWHFLRQPRRRPMPMAPPAGCTMGPRVPVSVLGLCPVGGMWLGERNIVKYANLAHKGRQTF